MLVAERDKALYHLSRFGDNTKTKFPASAPEVGRRQAMARPLPPTALGCAQPPPPRRAAVWGPRRSARAAAGAGAAQRRQPAQHQLLPLAQGGPAHRVADGERVGSLLPAPRALQRADPRWPRRQ